MSSTTQKLPVGVTILGVLAAIAAGVALYHALQFLGVIPFILGRVSFPIQNFWGALVFGFNALLWAIVAWGLLTLKPWAWLFAIVVAVLGLLSAVFALLGFRVDGAAAGAAHKWSYPYLLLHV